MRQIYRDSIMWKHLHDHSFVINPIFQLIFTIAQFVVNWGAKMYTPLPDLQLIKSYKLFLLRSPTSRKLFRRVLKN